MMIDPSSSDESEVDVPGGSDDVGDSSVDGQSLRGPAGRLVRPGGPSGMGSFVHAVSGGFGGSPGGYGHGPLAAAANTGQSVSPVHPSYQSRSMAFQQSPQMSPQSFGHQQQLQQTQAQQQQQQQQHQQYSSPQHQTSSSSAGMSDQRSGSITTTVSAGGSSVGGGDNLSPGQLTRSNSVRPSSPSPSLTSDKDKEDSSEKSEREDEERRKRLQLYVFVIRCVAYPFNAKQPTDMTRRQAKVTKLQLQTLKERFLDECIDYVIRRQIQKKTTANASTSERGLFLN